MSEEKRMLGNYEVVNSIYIGDKEVVFGVDKSDKYPFLVSYCDYHNPFGVPWATESVGCDDGDFHSASTVPDRTNQIRIIQIRF